MPQTTGSATPTTPARGATIPHGNAVSSSPTTQQTPPAQRAPATGSFLLPWGLGRAGLRGQAPQLPHHRQGPISTRSWPKRVSSRPIWRKNTAPCGCSAPPWRGKPPRAANARANWAGKPVTVSTPTSTSTTRIRPASEPEAHRRRNTTAGHARALDTRGTEPTPRGAGAHRASGRPAGRELGVPHPPAGERTERWGRARCRALGPRGCCGRASCQPGAHTGQGAAPRHARAGAGRRCPQCHQRSTDEQSGGAGGSRLPPSTGWTLR
jgi:hypothetical protein